MLVDLQLAAARGREVAAQRPNAEMLADALALHLSLLEATIDVRRLERVVEIASAASERLSDWEQSQWYPVDGSPAAANMAWADDNGIVWNENEQMAWDENPMRDGIDLVRSLIAATIDHLRGTVVLLRTELARAPVAVARSGLEACATAVYVLDVAIDERERLRRFTNLRLAQLNEYLRDAEEPAQRDSYAAHIRKLLDDCQALGIQSSRWRQGSTTPYLPNAKGRQDVPQAMIESFIEGSSGALWRPMSAVVHSRESTMLMFDQWVGYDEGDERIRSKDIASHSIGAIFALVEVAPRLGSYLGWDVATVTENDSTLLTVWAAGAGLGDDAIRENLFGPAND